MDLESSFLFLVQIGPSSVVAQTFSFCNWRLGVLESVQLSGQKNLISNSDSAICLLCGFR